MTNEELKKLHVITCAIEGKCTVAQAAAALNLSERRIKQLKREVRDNGAESVIHGNRGRKPAHAISQELKDTILKLRQTTYKYEASNFLHFHDLLIENENLNISYAALYDLLNDATGAITGLYMCENECLLGYLEVTRQTLQNFGIPLCLYPRQIQCVLPGLEKGR